VFSLGETISDELYRLEEAALHYIETFLVHSLLEEHERIHENEVKNVKVFNFIYEKSRKISTICVIHLDHRQ